MNSKLPQEANFDLEQQFILRLPEDAARYLAEDIAMGIPLKAGLIKAQFKFLIHFKCS